MKKFYKDSAKPSKPVKSKPRTVVSKRLISQLSREANQAWSFRSGSRTTRFGMTPGMLQAGREIYADAKRGVKSTAGKVRATNKRYGMKVDDLTGGRLSDVGNVEFVLPAAAGGAYLGRKVYKTGRKVVDKKYKLQQTVKALTREQKAISAQMNRLIARDARVYDRLSRMQTALADAKAAELAQKVAKKAAKKAVRRRSVRMGSAKKSNFRPVIYSPVAARAQQSLVEPCAGARWYA